MISSAKSSVLNPRAIINMPLFIEASKAYSDGVETIPHVSLVSRREVKLSDFCDEFYWAVSELGEHITDISNVISNSAIGRQQPSSSFQLNGARIQKLKNTLRPISDPIPHSTNLQ
jgi:hypothetical protein